MVAVTVHSSPGGGSEKWFLVNQGGPYRPWSTTEYQGPVRATGLLVVHLDSACLTSYNHTLEIADQGRLWWSKGTMGTMELGVGLGALWSSFYILMMYLQQVTIELLSDHILA